MSAQGPLVGIFVGGGGTRMGGVAKGLLPAPGSGEALVLRALRVIAEALPLAPVVLVGDAREYGAVFARAISDDPPGIGPLGGLLALLREARRLGISEVVALSCDLPYFSAALLARLVAEAPGAAALSPRQDERFQPFFARYSSEPALGAAEQVLAAGERSLQRVLARLSARELSLADGERAALRDWDRPEDVTDA
jgi:molybdopterin-guanine dinucleotide biosynthesis protein A